ncbi:MAG: hypothetical protein A2W26_12210 [Acidobacteria bacterium RBG_16_64_8]|nr:MAG: hypothetical protein A2W26_12210 [Acidobacteria bacterium RBG_16_64_8]
MRRCSGGQFDPQVIGALLETLESDGDLRAILPPEVHAGTATRPAVAHPRAGAATAAASAPWGREAG